MYKHVPYNFALIIYLGLFDTTDKRIKNKERKKAIVLIRLKTFKLPTATNGITLS